MMKYIFINSLKITSLFSIILGSTSLSATNREEPLKELPVNEPSIATTLSSGGMTSGKPAQSLPSLSMISKKEKNLKKEEDIFALFDKAGRTKQIDLAKQLFIIATEHSDPTKRRKAQDRLDKSMIREIREIGVRAKESNNKSDFRPSSSSQNVAPSLVSEKSSTLAPNKSKTITLPLRKSKSNSPTLTAPSTIINAENKKNANGPNVGIAKRPIGSANRSEMSKKEKLLTKLTSSVQESLDMRRLIEKLPLDCLTEEHINGLLSTITNNTTPGDRICIIKAFADAKKKLTPNFIHAVTSFTKYKMTCKDKIGLINAFAKVKLKNLTPVHIQAVTSLTKNMSNKNKSIIIEAFAEVGLENLTPSFIQAATSLIPDNMDGQDRLTVIQVLAKVEPENLAIFKDAATFLIPNKMNNQDRLTVIQVLAKVEPENLAIFTSAAFSFVSCNMNDQNRLTIIQALAKVEPENFKIFKGVATSFVSRDMNDQDTLYVIQTLADVGLKKLELFKDAATFLSTEEKFPAFKALIKIGLENYMVFKDAVISIPSTGGGTGRRRSIINLLAKVKSENLTPEFIHAVTSFISSYGYSDCFANVKPEHLTFNFIQGVTSLTKDTGNKDKRRELGFNFQTVITLLTKQRPENLTPNFIQDITSLIEDISDVVGFHDKFYVIGALTNVEPESLTPDFIQAVRFFISSDRDIEYRVDVINLLANIRPEHLMNFKEAATFLISQFRYNGHWFRDINRCFKIDVIKTLANVPAEKQEFVYTHIQTLMNKIQVNFTRGQHVRQLVETLAGFDQRTAATFVEGVIRLVEIDKIANIHDEQRLLTHIETMHTRLTRATQDETRVLLTHRQSTHKKEAHESIAMSLERLKKRYPDAFQGSGIFDVVKAKLKSFSHNNTEDLFKSAVTNFKETYGDLNIGPEIDRLLTINPYTRAGANNEDILLNQRMRTFLKPFQENQEFRKDVESLVGRYSRMKDYDNALKVISFMERESAYRDQTSGMGFAQKLSLIYVAINDPKSQKSGGELTDQDIEGRWKVLFARYAKVYHEYGNSSSCTGGIFNAGVEALDRVHPDVNIIQSFRAFMQEISSEEDDKEYKKRVEIALSHLGEKAQKDPYYQDEIRDWRNAREELKASEESKEKPLKLSLPLSSSSKDEEE